MVVALVGVGIASVVRLADYWFRAEHVDSPALFVLLSVAFWYAVFRIVLGWINYAALAKPDDRVAPQGRSVAIFTTTREPTTTSAGFAA